MAHVGGRPAAVHARHLPHIAPGPCGGVAAIVTRAVVAVHIGLVGRRAVYSEGELSVERTPRRGQRVEERALLVGVPRARLGGGGGVGGGGGGG